MELHGGCTYYQKMNNPDERKDRTVKVGCDFQHYWDEGKTYNLSYVHSCVKNSIESFHKYLGGKIKIRSGGDGVYRYLEDFTQ